MSQKFSPQDVPNEPGVYVFRNEAGTVIYVGKAKSLRKRLSSYFQPSRARTADPKLRSLIHSIHRYEIHPVRNETEALLLESRLIKQYSPRYNVLLRDDKRFLLIKVDPSEPFPRLQLVRLRKNDGCLYFGPFPQAGAVRDTVDFLVRHFGLRTCTVRVPTPETRKHCLKHVIRACCGPCTGDISPEQYDERLQAAIDVLNGSTRELVDELEKRMERLAASERFEDAARTRDVIENIRSLCNPRLRNFRRTTLIPEVHMGQVRALKEVLGLARAPRTVECFDISNIAGRLAVGSMVCFRDGKPCSREYRRFRIKTVEGADDFAMMKEVIKRRYGRVLAEQEAMPDLIVVDGGRGQLNAAIEGLGEIEAPPVPVLGLAKRREQIILPGRDDPLELPRHNEGLNLLQALRDEAHRFALTYHRRLRKKRIANSVLEEIDGVGPRRREELLRSFGSVRRLRKASAEEISAVLPGIGPRLAERIKDYLRKNG